jgi:hypothetical protein
VLVTAGVALILGVILLRIYQISYQSYVVGSSKTSIQQKIRTAMLRITPLLRNAVPPDAVTGAVVSPAVGASSGKIVFYAPSSFFNEAFNPRAPVYCRAGISFSNGKAILSKEDPVPNTVRVLAENLESLSFTVKSGSTILVKLSAKETRRDADGKYRNYSTSLQTVVQIPYYIVTK